MPLFAGLSAYDLELLARRLRPRLAVPDERLMARGEIGDAMYFISSGTVEIETPLGVTHLSAGDFFGEMALALHVPRQADATARHRPIREHIDRVASDRSAMNRQPGQEAPDALRFWSISCCVRKMAHHVACFSTGIPHSMHTRTRTGGSTGARPSSFFKNDIPLLLGPAATSALAMPVITRPGAPRFD